MRVVLTPKLDEFVRSKVEAGLYSDTSEVVREALRLMQELEETKRQHLIDIIRQGEKDIAEGRYVDYGADQIEQMLTDSGW